MVVLEKGVWPPWRWVFGILLFAFIVRVAAMYFWMDRLADDPDAYREWTTQLAGRGVFANDGRVAYRPPLYPVLLLFTGAYDPHKLDLAARLHVILGLLTVWLTMRAGTRLGLQNWTFLAGALVAVDPILVHQSTVLMTETLAALLAIAALYALTCAVLEPGLGRALWAGVMLGLCCLCRPTFLPWAMLAPFVLVLFRPSADAWRPGLGRLVVPGGCALMLFLVVGAWTLRNLYLTGKPVMGTTHGGYTLYLGNNADFYAALRKSWSPMEGDYDAGAIEDEVGKLWHEAEWRPVMRGGNPMSLPGSAELILDADLYRLAYASIANDPAGFLRACLYRVRRFWGLFPNEPPAGTPALGWAVGVWYGLLFALAIAGLRQLWKYRLLWQSPWLFGLLLMLSFTAIHAVYWTDMRMRAPVMPVVCLAAAAGGYSIQLRWFAATLEHSTT